MRSRVKVGVVAGGSEFILPARCGLGGGMIVGAVLCLLVVLAVVIGIVDFSMSWVSVMVVFGIGVLFMLGVGLLFFGIKRRYTQYKVRIRGGGVEVVRELFNKGFISSFAEDEVMRIGLYSSSETNDKPDYGIVVEGLDKTRINFGYGHEEADLRWLASEMLSSLSGQGGLPCYDAMDGFYFSENDAGVLERFFKKQGVRVIRISGDEVSAKGYVIEKNRTRLGVQQILISLFLLLFGLGLWWAGCDFNGGDIMLLVVGGIIALGGLVLFIMGVRKLGVLERYIFSENTLTNERWRSGEIKRVEKYDRSALRNLYVDSSGSSYGSARYSVQLRGADTTLKIFRWAEEGVMEVVSYVIKKWLKPVDYSFDDELRDGAYGDDSMLDGASSMEEEVDADRYEPCDVQVYDSVFDFSDMKGVLWFLRLFIVVFMLLGLFLFVNGVFELVKAKESEFWPSVEGVVLASEVSVDNSGDDVSYGVDVTYRYVVDDRSYKGDSVAVSELNSGSRERAAKVVERYPVERLVEVYYDPSDVEFSVLEPGVTGASWMYVGLGFLFFSVGLIFFIGNERECFRGRKMARGWERCVT